MNDRLIIREELSVKWHGKNNEFSASSVLFTYMEKSLAKYRDKYFTLKFLANADYDGHCDLLTLVGYRLENDEEYSKRAEKERLIAAAFAEHDRKKATKGENND